MSADWRGVIHAPACAAALKLASRGLAGGQAGMFNMGFPRLCQVVEITCVTPGGRHVTGGGAPHWVRSLHRNPDYELVVWAEFGYRGAEESSAM